MKKYPGEKANEITYPIKTKTINMNAINMNDLRLFLEISSRKSILAGFIIIKENYCF